MSEYFDTTERSSEEKAAHNFLLTCLSALDKQKQVLQNEKNYGIFGFYSRWKTVSARRRTRWGSKIHLKSEENKLKNAIEDAYKVLFPTKPKKD